MAGGVLSNLTQSMAGMFTDGAVEKAVLYIYLQDVNQKLTEQESKREMRFELNNILALEQELIEKTQTTTGFMDNLENIGTDIKNHFTPGKKSKQKVGEMYKGTYLKFEVQYNPATIRLYSVNGKVQERGNHNGGVDKLSIMDFSGKSKMSFDLIFDDCDNMNAFMFNEVANMNVTSGINKGMSLLQDAGNTHSVRKRMDAIMSTLSTSATQQVVFAWSKMVFRGTITDVSNRFTMFNPQGNPIRGEMHIEITQDKKIRELRYDEGYWQNAFKTCFKSNKNAGSDGIAGIAGKQNWVDKATNNPFINI